MGYNDSDGRRLPIIVDVETCPHPCAADFIEKTDPASVRAPSNYKKPEAITAYIQDRIGELEQEHVEKLARASRDWNLSRIVAIGWSLDGGETVTAYVCRDERDEAAALDLFWTASHGRLFMGFCARTFDLPTLIQRSRLLNVPHRDVNLARFGKGSVIDLRDVLTFDDARYDSLMSRSLKMFCRRFGVPVDDPIDGSMIGQLVIEGNWDAIIQHVASDVQLTAALARRIGVLRAAEVPNEAVV